VHIFCWLHRVTCDIAVLETTTTTALAQRDSHIRSINELGRMNRQKTSGSNRRSRVEAAIGHYKRAIKDGLRSRDGAPRMRGRGRSVVAQS